MFTGITRAITSKCFVLRAIYFRQTSHPYMFCIARGRFRTGSYFPGKCLPVQHLDLHAYVLSFWQIMVGRCLSVYVLYRQGKLCTGIIFLGKYWPVWHVHLQAEFSVTRSLTFSVTQAPSHSLPGQAPSHSPPTQATFKHFCEHPHILANVARPFSCVIQADE